MAKEKSEFSKALDEHNAKSMAMIQTLMNWDKIDLGDAVAVKQRCFDYFSLMSSYGKRPLVSALAMALGMDRRRLYEITRGQITANKETHIPQECKDIIIDAYRIIEVAWEDAMASGKINPVAGIFIAKNNFGYRNDAEVIVSTRNTLGEPQSQEELEARLLASVVHD